MTIYDVLKIFRDISNTERLKGEKFEKLMLRWLKADPTYSNLFTEVWMWNDFPFRKQFGGGQDLGIDLVAKDDKGGYWAIQCKCYDSETIITQPMVANFIALSGKCFKDENDNLISFSGRMWISTSNKYNKNAESAFENQTPSVTKVNLNTLDESQVDWELLVNGKNGNDALKSKATPRKHQEPIIKAALEHFKDNERGTLVMACGTGKTLTSLFITQSMLPKNGLVLFLAPSIALVGQSLNSWFANSQKPMKAVCVCSDRSAGLLFDDNPEGGEEDFMKESLTDLPIRSCTNVDTVVQEIERYKDHDGLLVCFSTYQSIDVVSEAQKKLLERNENSFGEFDFVICDEAHRTASVTCSGQEDNDFSKIHNGDFIKAKHRMYMTATPKIYNESSKSTATLKDDLLYSMDNKSIYGKHFYTLGFGTAVQDGLLTDYKVLVLTIDEKQATSEFLEAYKKFIEARNKQNGDDIHHITPEQQQMILGSVSALSKQVMFANKEDFAEDEDLKKPMHTAIAFCDNVRRYEKTKDGVYVATEITKAFEDVTNVYKEVLSGSTDENDRNFVQNLVDVKAKMVSGDMPTNERNGNLQILRENFSDEEKRCNIVCNVNCLSEGVDVPALDAAIFLAAKSSMITIVQSVGRVMRKFAGKKYGYIIVPVVIPAGSDPNKELDKNKRYEKVWNILNAMRSHDERLAAELSNHKYTHVKAVVPRPPRGNGDGSNGGGGKKGGGNNGGDIEFPMDFTDKLYTRMVEKVGEKFYWENWSKKVGDVAQNFIFRLNECVESGKYANEIDNFVHSLQECINPSIDREQAITFLAQQMITQPVFDALFPSYDFAKNNTVSCSMQKMLETLKDEAFVGDKAVLKEFYDNVKQVSSALETLEDKQSMIKTLYEKFFKGAFPKTVEQLGIVYTPVECVDFIIKSVDDVLKKEFDLSIKDRGVNILDPFTGTGTFIARTLQYFAQQGISKEDLKYKYQNEIHCNEIVLLSYYIADVNIESVYNDLAQQEQYEKFSHICMTDTFQLTENPQYEIKFPEFFKENIQQVKDQMKLPIKVIIGNPPYSIGQKSADDNAQNLHYNILEKRLVDTYAKESSANLQKSIYDSYIKAFRWASDRILANDNEGGIVAFISNGSWLDGNALDGMRKCVEKEFTDIYVFNLRGNQRTSGELSRKEGGKIFGGGSRTPIAITLLVNNPKKTKEKADIHYLDIGDYLTREEKLTKIKTIGSVLSPRFGDGVITPNEHGDWISMRNDKFSEYIAINPDDKFNANTKSFFTAYSLGIATNKDSFLYNSSLIKLKNIVNNMVDYYNGEKLKYQADNNYKPQTDKSKIVWTDMFIKSLYNNDDFSPDENLYCESLYRPFFKQKFIYQKKYIQRTYQQLKIFPTAHHKNLAIGVSGVGHQKPFATFITTILPDLQVLDKNQYFPLYWYESKEEFLKRTKKESGQLTLNFGEDQTNYDKFGFDEYGYIRHDGVSDYILKEIKSRFGLNVNSTAITKEDVFYYVYGILHSNEYRTTFEADLKKSLPHIPIVDTVEEFKAFLNAGRELAELHLNYENVAPCPDVVVDVKKEDFTVRKMKFASKTDKSQIIYNGSITLKNIPLSAYDYVVNGKSAIEWIMERYCISQDKDSLIVNDCNDWGKEHGNERYILDLLLSVINVSVQTVEIVNNLPKLKFE